MNAPKPEATMPEMPIPKIIWLCWNPRIGEFSLLTNQPANFVRPSFEWCERFIPEESHKALVAQALTESAAIIEKKDREISALKQKLITATTNDGEISFTLTEILAAEEREEIGKLTASSLIEARADLAEGEGK
jgi:hypothetical protein